MASRTRSYGAYPFIVDRYPYLWERHRVKTTVEIPDRMFRKAKAAAASRGLSLKTFLTEALADKLSGGRRRDATWPVSPPTLARGEMRRVQAIIDEEFSRIDAREWK